MGRRKKSGKMRPVKLEVVGGGQVASTPTQTSVDNISSVVTIQLTKHSATQWLADRLERSPASLGSMSQVALGRENGLH